MIFPFWIWVFGRCKTISWPYNRPYTFSISKRMIMWLCNVSIWMGALFVMLISCCSLGKKVGVWKIWLTYIFLFQENNLHFLRELILSSYGNFQCGLATNNPLLRYMTTVGYPEPSSGQDSSATSPDLSQPQRIKFKRLDKTAKYIMNVSEY